MGAVDVDTLRIEVDASAEAAARGIESFIKTMEKMRIAVNDSGSGLSAVRANFNELGKVSGVTATWKALSSTIKASKTDYSSFASSVRAVGESFGQLSPELKKSASEAIKAQAALNKLGAAKVAVSKHEVGESLVKFADLQSELANGAEVTQDTLRRYAEAFNELPAPIQRAIMAEGKYAASQQKVKRSLLVTRAQLSAYGMAIRKAYGLVSSWVDSTNDYIETTNLFAQSMGNYYDKATEYAEIVNNKLKIDKTQWMDAQGTFMLMARGFGVTNEQAYDLSKGLTELAYDISSLKNIDVGEAINKLRSAFAGELEPIRALGLSISQATLQEYALSKGIYESVSAMTEQEKALLRAVKVMEDSTRIGYVGDFARTLESPANTMRVLKQQFIELERTIGSVFLPIIAQTLPWIQALTSVLTEAAASLATFVGFTMPKWEPPDWENTAQGTADAIGNITSEVKKLKTATMSVDELNIISPDTGAAGAGGALSGWAADLKIPDIWTDEMMESIKSKSEELKSKVEPIFDLVSAIGLGFAGWKVGSKVLSGLSSVTDLLRDGTKELKLWGNLKKGLAGLIVMSVGVKLAYDAGFNYEMNPEDMVSAVLSALGPVAAALGGYVLGNTMLPGGGGYAGAAIGFTLGLIANIKGTVKARKQNIDEQFWATELGQEMIGFKERISASVENVADIKVRLSSITGEIDAETLANLNIAKDLINDIFTLSDKGNLTSAELGEIQSKVKILNDMDLEGLKIDLDPEGKIGQTKEQILGVVDALKKQYQMEAAKEALVELYKRKYETQIALDRQQEEHIKLLKNQADSERELISVQGELAYYRNQLKQDMDEYGTTYMIASGEAKKYGEVLAPLVERERELKRAIEEGGTQIATLNAEMANTKGVLDEVSGRISGMQGIILDLAQSSQGVGVDVGTQLGEGIKESIPFAESAMKELAEATLTTERDYNGTASPAKRYIEEGMYVAQGYAQGIKEYAPEAVSAMEEMSANVFAPLEAKTQDTTSNVTAMFADSFESTQKTWSVFPTWFKTTVAEPVKKHVNELLADCKIKMDAYMADAKLSLDNAFEHFKKTLEEAHSLHNEFTTEVRQMYEEMSLKSIDAISGIISKLDDIPREITTVHTIITRHESSGGGDGVEAYASGGFPKMGELFIAREQGPELVGQIGNKTAVANNGQITEGIAAAVERANSEQNSLLRQQNELLMALLQKEIAVRIGDKAIGEANDRYTRNRGAVTSKGAYANAY